MQSLIKLKSSRWKTIIPVSVVGVMALSIFLFLFHLGDNRGYSPKQPIPFSHQKHAGRYKIPCQYCHVGVDKARHAMIPSMNICMNCHSMVKPDSPYIQKMKELYQKGDSFEWVKIHDMPDFVFFNHERHIAKDVPCQKCHGDIASMDRVYQVERLNMKFCIECHREKEAPTSCDTCHH